MKNILSILFVPFHLINMLPFQKFGIACNSLPAQNTCNSKLLFLSRLYLPYTIWSYFCWVSFDDLVSLAFNRHRNGYSWMMNSIVNYISGCFFLIRAVVILLFFACWIPTTADPKKTKFVHFGCRVPISAW